MTNRRKSAKGKAAASKKAESPEKPTRRLNRRSKRNRKSESPEAEPEDVASDNSAGEDSADEVEKNRSIDKEDDNENQKDESDNGESRNSDEQKSQLKEDESGNSDGSWKVKSENGGGGGIPKLKLCLTRPPEMSSPTSEQIPSPRRRRRAARGILGSPVKEDAGEDPTVAEGRDSPKRATRSRRGRAALEAEKTPEQEEKTEPHLPEEIPAAEVRESVNENHNEEENETRLAVESISENQTESHEENLSQRLRERIHRKEVVESAVEPAANEHLELEIEQEAVSALEEEKEETAMAVEAIQSQDSNLETEQVREFETVQVQEFDSAQEPEPEPEQEAITIVEPEQPTEEKERRHEPEQNQQQLQRETEVEPEPMEEESKEEAPEEYEEKVVEAYEKSSERRSSSRDSSEERAKQEALMSRNRNRKKEASEEGEVVEESVSSEKDNGDRSSPTKSLRPTANEIEQKESNGEPAPVVRKRRWGSTTSKAAKKPSVSISTDFLKEIIPEAKPLAMNEVQLSPNEEEEEGQLKDSEENLPTIVKKVEREKMVQSDESEKDYEEDAVESGADEAPQTEIVKSAPAKEKEYTTFTRKVSVLPSNDLNKLQRSPSPPRNPPSNILYIINLVRPFTIPQLRELLARTGTIVEDGFWIDKIKSRCYVKYETEEEAKATRHALHGVRWPVSNPKQLNVDYGTESAMKAAQEGNEIASKRSIPSLFDKQIDLKSEEKIKDEKEERSKERRERLERLEKERKERKHREDERREEEEKEKKIRPPVEPLVRDRTVRRVTVPVREWDVGKNEDGFSPPLDGTEYSRQRGDDRYERRAEYERDKRDDYDDRRRRERDRGRRSLSGEPPRKSKKKSEEEAPAKLLDDLFRKTKATPCIYWLPLTAEQIAVKEEMRRKHMAEHEKKIAELRKIQREQNKRSSDKRRRRSKSRSRSRSPKK